VPPDISIVIPTWNGAGRIVGAIDSLAAQTLATDRFEIVVVDDGSVDGTADVVRQWTHSHPDFAVNCHRQANGGVNAARNAGILASRARYIMLLDDDEMAPADHLQRVVTLLDARCGLPGAGGPYRLTGDQPFRTCSRCRIGEARLPIDGAGPTERLLGGNMTVRRTVFDEVGLFDPDISGRGDETEWFARAGRSFWYDEALFVWHRRDHMTLRQLLRTGYRQGQSVPRLHEKVGDVDWRPSPAKVVRYLGHAVRRRCVNGLLQASREAGSVVSWSERWSARRVRRLRERVRS
jgi:glycosyltransferase involved in cell wall biosynthesis